MVFNCYRLSSEVFFLVRFKIWLSERKWRRSSSSSLHFLYVSSKVFPLLQCRRCSLIRNVQLWLLLSMKRFSRSQSKKSAAHEGTWKLPSIKCCNRILKRLWERTQSPDSKTHWSGLKKLYLNFIYSFLKIRINNRNYESNLLRHNVNNFNFNWIYFF